MSTKYVAAALVCAGALAAGQAWSEETAPQEGYENFSLGEVYIKSEKPSVVKQTTVTNEITAEDIKATNSHTVAEALAYTPGIRVSTGRKSEPNIQIRGLDQSRVLIMIDGVPYYAANSGKLDLNQIPVDNIAKIEVTKGAASVLYGANALGGVVNIITKKAAGKPTFDLLGEVGENDYFRTSASHGLNTGKVNYWLNYSHAQSHGWNLSDNFTPTQFEDGGKRTNSDFATDSVWAKFGVEPTAHSDYSLNFYYISREKGAVPSTINNNVTSANASRAFFSQFGRIPRYEDWGLDLSGQQQLIDIITIKAKAFYHNHADTYDSFTTKDYTVKGSTSSYHDYTVGGSLITEIKPVKWNATRISFNYRGDSHKQQDDVGLPEGHFFSYTGSVGLENEITFNDHFSVVVGGSYDWFKIDEAFGTSSSNKTILEAKTKPDTRDSLNGMIGATYSFADSTKLFASIARKTRFPTLDDLYSSSRGNAYLKPEKAMNSTVGVSRSFSPYFWGELAFFYNEISNFISRDIVPNRNQNQNLGRIELYGIEVNTQVYPAKDLTLKLGYTFNNASDQSDNRVTDRVVNIPEHKLDLGVSYTVPVTRTVLDLNGILMSEVFSQLPTPRTPTQETQRVGGYFTFNAKVSQKFLKNYEAYFAVNNIADRNYQSEYGFPAQGRSFMGGVSAKF